MEQCYEYVDALSLHRYIGNTKGETGEDSAKFVAMNLSMEQQIAETLAVCDLVRGHKRSPKKLWLSFDEWNVWYRARDGDAINGHEQEAPHLLEEVYNLEDALRRRRNSQHSDAQCGPDQDCMSGTTGECHRADRHQCQRACSSRRSIYPYSWALQWARGNVLQLLVESPTYESPKWGRFLTSTWPEL